MKRIAALSLSFVVHALTLAFAVLGGWTIYLHPELTVSWLVGGLLIAIGVLLRPRVRSLPADAEVLTREEAPELHAAAERVADDLGVRRPVQVAVLDLATASGVERIGLRQRPVLVIGLPLWLALSPRQRTTLLVGAYARGEGDDGLIVEGALSTLAEWRHSLFGTEPQRDPRDESYTMIAMSAGLNGSPATEYQAAGFFGRVLGRALGWPVLLVERALLRLTRSGDSRTAGRRLALMRKVACEEELAELAEVAGAGAYLAPMQSAALRGESVAQIREAALTRSRLAEDGVLTSAPGSRLLGGAESARIDLELEAHYARAVRGFGLIS